MRWSCLLILALSTCSQVLALPTRDLGGKPDPLTIGLRFEQNRETGKARDVFREIIKSNPENLDARRQLVYSYFNSSDPADVAKGIDELVAALASRPDYAEFWRIAAEITAAQIFNRKTYGVGYENATRLLLYIAVEFSKRPELVDRSQAEAIRKLRELLVDLMTSLQDMERADRPYDEREAKIAESDASLRPLAAELARSFYAKGGKLAPIDPTFPKRTAAFIWRLTEEFGIDATWAAQAREAAAQAREVAPYDADSLVLLGRANLISAKAVKAAPGDQNAADEKRALLESSQQAYRQAMVLRPYHPTALEELALAYGEAQDTEAGAAFFQAEIDDAPDDHARLLAMRCMVQLYMTADRKDQAGQALRSVLERFPDYTEGYIKLMDLYTGMENGTEKAVAVLEEVTRTQPDFINAHVWLGSFYQQTNQPEKAEQAYTAALRLLRPDVLHFRIALPDPNMAWVSARMVVVHRAVMGLSAIYGSRREFTKAGDTIANYLWVYGETGQSRDAPIYYEPREIPAEALLQAGMACFSAGQRGTGIKRLEDAIKVKNGHYYEAQRRLAALHMGMLGFNVPDSDPRSSPVREAIKWDELRDHLGKALTLWEQISRDRPGDPAAQYQVAQLGLVFTERSPDEFEKLQSGRASESELTQSMAIANSLLKDQPNNMSALLLRASIYELLGDSTKALADATAARGIKQDEAFTTAPPIASQTQVQSDQPVVDAAEAGPLRRCAGAEFNLLQAQALGMIAWLQLGPQPDLQKAEELAQQAYTAAPALTPVIDTLAWVLYLKAQSEQDTDARKALLAQAFTYARQAVRTIRITPRLYYHLAEIILASDQTREGREQAKACAEAAIAINERYPEAREAAALLEKLKSSR